MLGSIAKQLVVSSGKGTANIWVRARQAYQAGMIFYAFPPLKHPATLLFLLSRPALSHYFMKKIKHYFVVKIACSRNRDTLRDWCIFIDPIKIVHVKYPALV